jgi:hypothetical protein
MDYRLSTTWATVLIIGALWELIWKGVALWKAGRSNQLGWFVALLVVNSVGILPIIYLLTHHTSSNEEKEYGHEKAVLIKE